VPLLLEAGLDPSVVDSEGDTPAASRDGGRPRGRSCGVCWRRALQRTARNYSGRTPFGEPIEAEEQRERDVLFERAADAVAFGALENAAGDFWMTSPIWFTGVRRARTARRCFFTAEPMAPSGRDKRTPPNAPAIRAAPAQPRR